ncbi:MAG TPA: DUF2279 domain-containing protein [Cytophagaceae bacterium]|nr:DUF2279 domain-containing protein [Cytophagaceae bacterium]
MTNKKRLTYLIIGSTVSYGASLYGLNELWYKNNPRTSFHFFNDNREWKQMDKVGHFYTSFYLSTIGIDLLKWSGVPEKKAIILDNALGILLLTPIEILDGYSSAYGASWGDEIADASGDLFVLGQYLLWKQLYIYPKFSFHSTGLAKLRPNVLGSNIVEQSLKDYNGQTYWLSFPIKPLIKKNHCFPDWLNISMGYGAYNMVYANPAINKANGYNAYRRYFLSLDINFRNIKTKSKALKTFFYMLNLVHVPLPALEYNSHRGIVFHAVYF